MKLDMQYGERVTEEFQRKHLAELLSQCTDAQQDVFNRMYPNGPKKSQLAWAMTQCHNSVMKNLQGINIAE